MKTKTEAKRNEILKSAGEVFREMGFERASMSNIRARVGGSKATLYNYFPSKEILFFEVMLNSTELKIEAITGTLNPDANDLKQELVHLGQNFLTIMYSPEVIAARRLAIAEAQHSNIGKLVFEQGISNIEVQVAKFLRKVMKRGALRTTDAKIAATHLLSLYESELLQRVLLGVIDSVKTNAFTGPIRRAVDVFLSGYVNH